MKRSRFTEEQIVGILRETDRDPIETLAKRHGVSEQENARVKKLVAERDLEIEVMKEIAAKIYHLPYPGFPADQKRRKRSKW